MVSNCPRLWRWCNSERKECQGASSWYMQTLVRRCKGRASHEALAFWLWLTSPSPDILIHELTWTSRDKKPHVYTVPYVGTHPPSTSSLLTYTKARFKLFISCYNKALNMSKNNMGEDHRVEISYGEGVGCSGSDLERRWKPAVFDLELRANTWAITTTE